MKSICQEGKLPTLFFIIEFDESEFLRILTRVRDKKRLEKVGNLVKNLYLYR